LEGSLRSGFDGGTKKNTLFCFGGGFWTLDGFWASALLSLKHNKTKKL